MQSKKEFKSFSLNEMTTYPFVKGSVLGASVMYLMTPLLNYTNHYLDGKKMVMRKAMTGSLTYASSAAPSYALSFAIYNLLKRKEGNQSSVYDGVTSFLAGAAAGFAGNVFENLAQNKQLAKLSSSGETVRLMIKHHGFTAPFQGSVCTMAREGLWVWVVLSAIRNMSKQLVAMDVNKNHADFFATVVLAGLFGALSSPANQLRFLKQKGLTEPTPRKSYLEHAKDIWEQNPEASSKQRFGFFFKGWKPRAFTTTVAAGMMYKGQEWYDEFVQPK